LERKIGGIKMIETNPNIRCERCGGRLVVETLQDGRQVINLTNIGGKIVCKNRQECDRNIQEESNILDIIVSGDSMGFYDRKRGEELLWIGVKNV
jgi:hypothetical protein